ncbi:cystathionine gamma-synthase [Barrientosiimonas humi]|uniref:cystathionine gamma-synthase n=1 Tax=Barrientosiimonas humi TaxID=999931 RepID=UPI00370D9AAB
MTDQTSRQGFSTRAIHAGQEPDPRTGAVVPAIYQTSTYKQDGVGGFREGYEYSRSANPTRTALEECIADLEGGARGFAFASGLAGEDAIMRGLLGPGDHMVVPTDAYGGTYRLVAKVQQRWGVDHSLAKVSQPDAIRGEIRPGVTKMIWLETPTNPLLGIADIAAIAEIAHEAGALLVVDNTFASPYLQQPIALGADIVVHSTTKYVGGHSDVVGGAVVVAPQIAVPEYADAAERIAFHQNSMGGVAGPMDSWLTLRGLKTLAVRMERHCDNAERVVEFLRGRSDVTHVNYPGLDSHPGHDVAAKQMRRFGGMVSFQVEGGEQRALDIVGSTKLWILGESLGGVESLIEHPGRMTHASVAGTELEVPSDLIRLSVGIEDVDDLVADLEQAMG